MPSFSRDEWAACLKVLGALAVDPGVALDREAVGRLVARVYRQTRRGRRRADEAGRRQDDRTLIEATGQVRWMTGAAAAAEGPDLGTLRARGRRCYICKERYRTIDAYYHRLCPACAAWNRRKREQRVDLAGRRAIVTGGRIKIGHRVALKLLRDGAEVLVTTRFPTEAALRFAAEADSGDWLGRLEVARLDFRAPGEVVAFADRLVARPGTLDILVNNAAQTVRRPDGHFAEARALDHQPLADLPPGVRAALPGPRTSDQLDHAGSGRSLAPGAELRPLAIGPEAPPDLREANSWTARLAEVGPVEALEVLLVNALAPFLLIGQLKPLFLRSSFADRYVVNVAGLDAQFGRASKTDRHPHVNMSKAALNMITRTSAADLARDGIYMNSVDAGWVTDEGGHSARLRRRAEGFVPPLDEADAAARVYDPIVRGIRGEPDSGQFFKDYRPTAW